MTAIGALAAIFVKIASARAIRSRCGNDLVDQADAIGLLRANHLTRENQLQRAPLADEARQPLCPAAARNKPERDLGLAEFRALHGYPQGARQRGLTAPAERETIDGRNYRLPKISL